MSLEQKIEALEARVQALENAAGLTRPTVTSEMSEHDFFALSRVDGMWLMERARMDGKTLEAQAIYEAVQKGAVAGARLLPNGNYEVTQFIS